MGTGGRVSGTYGAQLSGDRCTTRRGTRQRLSVQRTQRLVRAMILWLADLCRSGSSPPLAEAPTVNCKPRIGAWRYRTAHGDSHTRPTKCTSHPGPCKERRSPWLCSSRRCSRAPRRTRSTHRGHPIRMLGSGLPARRCTFRPRRSGAARSTVPGLGCRTPRQTSSARRSWRRSAPCTHTCC
jgi:hypothetical protein